MKRILAGALLVGSLSNIALAQNNFDIKKEITTLENQAKNISDDLSSLYSELNNSDNDTKDEIEEMISRKNNESSLNSAKLDYVYSLGFSRTMDQNPRSKFIEHMKNTKNLFAAISIKDSIGNIVHHSAVSDLIDEAYDQSSSTRSRCSINNDNLEDSFSYLFNTESDRSYLNSIVKKTNYHSASEILIKLDKDFCSVLNSTSETNKCSEEMSETRISLLKEIEKEVIFKRDSIDYHSSDDREFIEFELAQSLSEEIADRVSQIEAICVDNLNDEQEMIDHIQTELLNNSLSIEYTNPSVPKKPKN